MGTEEMTPTVEDQSPVERHRSERQGFLAAALIIALWLLAAILFGYGGFVSVAVFYSFAFIAVLVLISRG